MSANWNKLQRIAIREVESTLGRLPEPLRAQARKIPVILEPAPNVELQSDGIEMDTLGLFTGAEFADFEGAVLPPQIILFLENLWAFAAEDESVFCEEIQKTYLHELGHFLGLDEDGLLERGLE